MPFPGRPASVAGCGRGMWQTVIRDQSIMWSISGALLVKIRGGAKEVTRRPSVTRL
jgi:hypothetical protein